MIKKLFFTFFFLIIIAALAAVFVAPPLISKGIVEGVNRFGPDVTQTKVSLAAANISLFKGSATLENLLIGNPDGYTEANAFEMGKIAVDLDITSLTEDTIVIKRVFIQEPKINYEKKLIGSNLQALQKNIEASIGRDSDGETAPTESEADKKDAKPAKKVIIEEFIVEGATVKLTAVGQTLPVNIPTLKLMDIGKDEGGIDQVKAVSIFMVELTQNVVAQVSNKIGDVKELGNDVVDQVKDVSKDAEKTLDKIKDLKNLF